MTTTATIARGAGRVSPLSRQARKGYLRYLLPGAVGFLAVVFVPFLMNIGISFTNWSGVGSPTFVGLENYRRLMRDHFFWSAFEHSIWFIVAMAIVPTVLGLFLAAVLFDYIEPRFGQRVSSVLRAGFYLPQVLPVAVAGVVWGWILNPYGAINAALQQLGIDDPPNWLGDSRWALPSVMLVLVWMQLGYGLVIFMAGMARIDPQYHEAAELDGASWFARFRHVTVPHLRPEVFVVLLTTAIAALKVFGPVYVLTKGGPGNATNVPSYYSYSNFFGSLQVGYGAAVATILTLVVIAMAIVFIRIQSKNEGV
ncbi:sugar ABC transporter permease [Nocardioides pocheonensis]|uniref:Sugar ABC transporter permease n=1 Tax=Nocardioides pocheonensis TaxID=661485 RepID=A0A3N0GKA9_9ACTN|nr:sugar ABC transporter permease [Nocardioides pocheonensis]